MTIWVRNKYDVLVSVSTRTHRSKYVVLVSVSTRTRFSKYAYSQSSSKAFSLSNPPKAQSSRNQTLTKHQFSRKRTDEHTHNNNLRQAQKRSILDLPTKEESLGRKSLGFKSKYYPLQKGFLVCNSVSLRPRQGLHPLPTLPARLQCTKTSQEYYKPKSAEYAQQWAARSASA